MELLPGCDVGGAYEYTALEHKQERVTIRNVDELYARLPVGAASLEGKLARSGELFVDMTIVGRKEARRHVFERSDLNGRCDGATHVLTGLTVGAFSLVAGSSLAGGASVGVSGARAGGGVSRAREVIASDGDPRRCDVEVLYDELIPGCRAVLRVEAIPLAGLSSMGATVARPVAEPSVASHVETPAIGPRQLAGDRREEEAGRTQQRREAEDDVDPAKRERLRRRRFAAAWRGIGVGSSVLAGGSFGLMVSGAVLLGQYNDDARDPDYYEREEDRTKRKTGTQRVSLGLAGALGFGALTATAFALSHRLHYNLPPITASVSPRFTGLTVQGRF